MNPWSFATILASDILTWAVQQASKEGVNSPAAIYLDHLAERVGLTQVQLFRILSGHRFPTISQLAQLCQAIGSTRAVAVLAEDCGQRVCGRKVCAITEATEPLQTSRAA